MYDKNGETCREYWQKFVNYLAILVSVFFPCPVLCNYSWPQEPSNDEISFAC